MTKKYPPKRMIRRSEPRLSLKLLNCSSLREKVARTLSRREARGSLISKTAVLKTLTRETNLKDKTMNSIYQNPS